MSARNRFEAEGVLLEQLASLQEVKAFDCGDADLNEYFHKDCEKYKAELLTQTYGFFLVNETPRRVVAMIDFCNDSLARNLMKGGDKRRIHHNKRGYRDYPAIKITRLGVDVSMHRQGLGSALLDIVKRFFVTDNRSGCRFITVDAYREAIPFYERNGFILAKTVEDEEDKCSSTVAMFFDLKRLTF